MVRMNTRHLAGPYLVARTRHVAAGRVELACDPVALVLARGDSFGAWAVGLAVAGAALRRNERGDEHQAGDQSKTHQSQHGDLHASNTEGQDVLPAEHTRERDLLLARAKACG
jgi:hypothetical protein